MSTSITVQYFRVLKNQILGRLSQCKDPAALIEQLRLERDLLREESDITREEKDMFLGIDRGIHAANQAIKGDTEPLDTL